MSEVIINAILQAKPGKEEELRSELVKVIEPSREEKGCIQYTLHQDTDKAGTFVFMRNGKAKKMLKLTLKHLTINNTDSKQNR